MELFITAIIAVAGIIGFKFGVDAGYAQRKRDEAREKAAGNWSR